MIPDSMQAMVLTRHGGIDAINWEPAWPVPQPGPGEVLVRVTATAKNNTDRKVREGLYATSGDSLPTSFRMAGDTLQFPRIQGADVVGRIVAVGEKVGTDRIEQRGLLDFNIYRGQDPHLNLTPDYFGHGADGGFAEYGVFPAEQFHHISNPELSDAELASLGMCSWQTGYHMLTSAGIREGENVLITGASGGVGTALIQLCRIIGAIPHAISGPGKAAILHDLGAETVIDRTKITDWPQDIASATGGVVIDAVMDLVGGEITPGLIDAMCSDLGARRTPPRLSIAGASAGNVTQILWTQIYLNQVQIFGASHGTRAEAEQLIHWIRQGRLRPVLAGTMKLSRLHDAERLFADRSADFLGKLVIVPDAEWQRHGAAYELS